MRPIWFCLVMLSVLATGCGDSASSHVTDSGDDATRIAVIPKGTTHIFWKSVEAGARKAAGEATDVDMIWKGPLDEGDRAQQRQLVQQFTADKVDAIVLAPTDFKALAGPVKDATAAGIKVVIIDSGLDAVAGEDFVSFVATNNRQGGKLGGEKLVELLGSDGGKVVVLRYMVGSESTQQREAGFIEAVRAAPGIEIISDNQHAGSTKGEALKVAQNMKDQLEQADAVFTPNESSTAGMLEALRKLGLAGRITFVGFDTSPPLIEALRNGEIHALVAQNPTNMGYQGVKAALAALKGETVDPQIDTGVAVITKDNLDTPDIQALLGL